MGQINQAGKENQMVHDMVQVFGYEGRFHINIGRFYDRRTRSFLLLSPTGEESWVSENRINDEVVVEFDPSRMTEIQRRRLPEVIPSRFAFEFENAMSWVGYGVGAERKVWELIHFLIHFRTREDLDPEKVVHQFEARVISKKEPVMKTITIKAGFQMESLLEYLRRYGHCTGLRSPTGRSWSMWGKARERATERQVFLAA
jgi:hypothetical protein